MVDDEGVWNLVLYVAGSTAKSLNAIKNLKAICDKHLNGKYKISVVDLLKQPHLAKEHQIFAVPTLVKHLPVPARKILGDLSNTEKVLLGLSLTPVSS